MASALPDDAISIHQIFKESVTMQLLAEYSADETGGAL
jgi:hypothetical protein